MENKPNTSSSSQRNAIMNHFHEYGVLRTLYAREEMGIMSPAARVLELRKQGHNIVTHWTITIDKAGTKHREAKYVLFSDTIKKEAPTTSDQTNNEGIHI
jgi:hypothetical protein